MSNSPISFRDPIGHWKMPSFTDIINAVKSIIEFNGVIERTGVKDAAKDIAKSELEKAFVVEFGPGNGYGIEVNQTGIKSVSSKGSTRFKPFEDPKITEYLSSEEGFTFYGIGYTRTNGEDWQFNTPYSSMSKDSIFIGPSVEAYLGAGAHFKIGFEFDNTNLYYYGYKGLFWAVTGGR